MELRQIQHFVQLYTNQNMTKASEALFISQQGLSKSILNLEKELDLSLFERSNSGVCPTDSADKLYHFFLNVLSSYQNLNQEAEKVRKNRTVKIAAPTGFSLTCDKNKFLTYFTLDPELSPLYKEYDHHLFPACLEEQRADIAFMLAPIPDRLQSHLIVSREQLYGVVSKEHPLSAKDCICVDDLCHQNLILLDLYDNFNTSILKLADSKNIPYHISKKATINEFLPFLCSGTLIGFSTREIFRHFNFPDILFIPVLMEDGSTATIDTHLVTLKSPKYNPKIQQYINYEKEFYKEG